MNIAQSFLDEVYELLDYSDLLKDLSPRMKHDRYELQCPGCGERSAWIYKCGDNIECNRRNNCGYKEELLTYLNKGNRPLGERFWELIKELAGKVGMHLPSNGYDKEAAEKYKRKLDELEKEWLNIETADLMPSGIKQYFEQRNFNTTNLHSLDIKWDGEKVFFPIRNRHGKLVGIVKRFLTQQPKYMYSEGLNFAPLGAIGLDIALQAATYENDQLILIEGVADMFAMRSWGIYNVAAIGGANMSLDRMRALYTWGVKTVILAQDNDDAGKNGTKAAIENYKEDNIPELFIYQDGKYLDINGLLTRGYGIPGATGDWNIPAEFKQYVYDHKVHAYKRKVYEFKSESVDNDGLIKRAIDYDRMIVPPKREMELKEIFWKEVQQLTGCDIDYILDLAKEVKDAERKSRKCKHAEGKLSLALEALKNGQEHEALDHICEGFKSASEVSSRIALQPVLYLTDRLPGNSQRLKNRRGSTSLGLLQKTLPSLDEATMGLRKFILLAAAPGIGKTFLLAQLMSDVLTNNENTCGLFVSWELTGDELIDRMKTRVLGVKYKDLQTKNTDEELSKADRALRKIGDRLVILEPTNCSDKEMSAERVIYEIDKLKRETACTHCIVAIDYLQIFPVPPDVAASRSDIARDDFIVNEMKKIRFHLQDDPLLVIAEVNKGVDGMGGKGLEKVKGSGRAVFSADGVFFLNPLTDEQLCEQVRVVDGFVRTPAKYGGTDWGTVKKADLPVVVKPIREHLEKENKEFLELSIRKFRDGGRRTNIPTTLYYGSATFKEGYE